MKQKFFLICKFEENHLYPLKIFLQESKAIKYGRTLATRDKDADYCLFTQEILENSEIVFEQVLDRFKD